MLPAIRMKIYKHIDSNAELKRFLIPKSTDPQNEIWAEIMIDFPRQKFLGYKRILKVPNTIEWEEYEGGTFPSSLFNEFLNSPPFEVTKWDYITGWEESGILRPEHLIKWAYVENGYFQEQDEELLMYRPELIQTMYSLLKDEYCNRKEDLLKTLKLYSTDAYKGNESSAIEEFERIKKVNSDDQYHKKLIDHLKLLSR